MLTISNEKDLRLEVSEIDKEAEIRVSVAEMNTWIDIDQTKQLIEFLTKQIEGK